MPPTQTTAPSMCSAKARAAMSGLPRSGDDKTILFGIPRMNPELAWMVAIFWIGRKPRCEVSMASASQTVRTALDLSGPGASDLATASHHSRRQLLANAAIIIARIEAVRTRRDPKTGSRYGVLNLLHNF